MVLEKITNQVYLYRDTCNVYVIKNGPNAVIIDFGSGGVLEHLIGIGIKKIDAILVTHHHRDQVQGLPLANQHGFPVWVPMTEQDLFHHVNQHWAARELINNYNVREDTFSLLLSVDVAGVLKDYHIYPFSKVSLQVIPTPGHTTGSISFLFQEDDRLIAFSGDLLYAPGKVWSLAATQWTYNGAEGIPATIASLLDLKDRKVDLLLPSHGSPIDDVVSAIDGTVERFWELLRLRGQNPRLFQLRNQPYQPVLPHLLKHRASMANTYVVLSESGKAMMIDFGYDFLTGIPAGFDRASRRPWLYTIPTLKKQFGVTKIDVVIPTHYHDDHVAGINLLHEIEGTQVWVAENFSEILQRPYAFHLPCLWYDPISVDQILPLGEPLFWEEYTFMLHPLPGHTRYAVALEFEVDGKRVLAVGDQYQGNEGLLWNYVYQNRYQIGDYQKTARLYKSIKPDVILPGHWDPIWVNEEYLMTIERDAVAMETLQQALLPDDFDLGSEGFLARIIPYQTTTIGGTPQEFFVEINNPFLSPQTAQIKVVAPQGWLIEPEQQDINLADTGIGKFQITPPSGINTYRSRIAVDIKIGEKYFGQQAEALVSVGSILIDESENG